MKNNIYLLVAFVSVFAVSCKKVLAPDTPSAFTPDYVFGTEDQAKKAVNNVYAFFNADAFTSRVSNNYAGNTDIEAGGVSSAPDGSRRDIWSFETTTSNSENSSGLEQCLRCHQ
jgi:hypothetical protein